MPVNTATCTPTLPFPWSDGPGLAPVLGDPDVWPLVITGDHRRLIKLVRPPRVLGRRRLAVDDDASFGAGVVELLASPATRATASQRLRAQIRRSGHEAQFGLSDLLAEHLVRWLVASFNSPCAALLPDAVRPTIAQSALTPARFRELASTLPAAPSVHAALLACAQGILRRRDALEYADVLVEHAPGYKDLLYGPHYSEVCPALEIASGDRITVRGPSTEPINAHAPALRVASTPIDAPIAVASPATDEDAESPGCTERSPALFDGVVDLRERGSLPAATPMHVVEADEPPEPPRADESTPEMISSLAEIRRLGAELGVSADIPDASSFPSARAFRDELEYIALGLAEQRQRRDELDELAGAAAERILAADPLDHAGRLGVEECAVLLDAIGGGSSAPRADRWRHLVEDDLLVVALVASVLNTDLERVARSLAGFPSSLRRRVAQGLDSRHLATLIVPGMTRVASLEIVARVLRDRRHSTLLPYLQPALYVEDAALSPNARTLLEACIIAGERGEPADAILRALAAGRAEGGEGETRALVLALIDQPPGMTGTFHRLRLSAQGRFLRPLRGLIADAKPRAALARFDAFGDPGSMVAECIDDLSGNAVRALEDQHFEQTRRYLANFRERLEEWAAGPEDPTVRPGARGIVAAWAALVDDCDDLIDDLARRVAAPGITEALTRDVDHWWYTDGESGLVVDESAIRPAMIRSWISAARGEAVPLACWSWERARVLLDREWSAKRSVERMLAAGYYRPAQLAADVDASLVGVVTPAIKAERTRLEALHAAPLSRATGLRDNINEIDEYLASIEDALGALDFAEAELWLEGLDDVLIEVTLRADPERRALLDFLAEAGQRPSTPRPALEELLADVDALREREGERRWHVMSLETLEAGLADDLRARLRGLAVAMDRPSRWPSVDRSRSLSDAIEAVFRYTQHQRDHWREYHEIEPDDVTRELIDLLERALAALPDGDDVERVLDLNRVIDLHAPFERVAQLISPSLRRRADEAYFESVRAEAREHLHRGDHARVLADLRGIPGADTLLLQAELGEHLHRGAPLDLDWIGLRRVLHQLRSSEDVHDPRLHALDAIARVIAETPPRVWPIDHLAKAQGEEHFRAALFVLSLHLRVAQRRPPSEGITLALVLPEQIFRVWARWELGLDFQSVPEGHALTWRQVRSLWDPDGRGNVMRIPEPGEKFPSFRCFAIFAQVAASMRRVAGLERTVHDLYAALRTLQVRHDGAHALAQASAERRRSFFGLVDRWLNRLYLACPAPVRREEIEALLEPLA